MRSLLFIVSLIGFSEVAVAAEISFVSGLMRIESYKENGQDAGGKNEISLGGRYAEPLDDVLHWFGEANLTLRSWKAAPGQEAPSNSTSLTLGGGMRMYFLDFSQSVTPYVVGRLAYVNDKDGRPAAGVATTEEKSGIYYWADFGLRLELSAMFFLDFESQLFQSALFATETTSIAGVKTETSRTDIYANTTGTFGDNARLAFGMRF